MGKKLTTAEFIRKSIEIHGTEKYDYSETEYKTSTDKVKIYCNTCKEFFWQKPTAHCSTGSGCRKCGLKKTHDSSRKSTDDFIIKAIKAKGIDAYDYSMTTYVDSETKIKIRCVKHDIIFEASPHDFLRPQRGCPLCGKEKMSASNLLSQDNFIARATEVHPEYDYSLLVYKTCRDKITVICPIHNEFQIRPDQLLQGQSCRKCAIEKRNAENSRRLTTEIFIERSKAKHGEIYDYSLVDYKSTRIPVLIGCRTHGYFHQKPSQHLKSGCKKCADAATGLLNRITTEEWVSRAIAVHGARFSYTNTVFKGNGTRVEICCLRHNTTFTVTPQAHLNGTGCKMCKKEVRKPSVQRSGPRKTLSVRMTNEEFTNKANLAHNYKYDYSRVEYVNSNTKVEIGCPEHGFFWQTPSNHLHKKKYGCQKCRNELTRKRFSIDTEQFVESAKIKHGNKYCYDLVEYIKTDVKVKILCRNCDSFFLQTPNSHLNGSGCNLCMDTGFNPGKPAVLYLHSITGKQHDFTGFGITRNIVTRTRNHTKNLNREGYSIVNSFTTDKLDGKFIQQLERLLKETFPLDPSTSHLEGFKTESTTTPYHEVVDFVRQYIEQHKETT